MTGSQINKTVNSILSAVTLKIPVIIYSFGFVTVLDSVAYGNLQVTLSYATIIFPLITLSVFTGYGRKIYDLSDNQVNQLTRNIHKTLTVFLLVFICMKLIFVTEYWMATAITLMCLSWFQDILLLQYFIRMEKVSTFNKTIVKKYLLIVLLFGPLFLLYGQNLFHTLSIAEFFGYFIGFFTLHRRTKKNDEINNIELFKQILSFSVPLVVYNLGQAVMSQVDRVMMFPIIGAEKVAVYSFNYNIAAIILLGVNGVFNSLLNDYFAKKRSNDVLDEHHLIVITWAVFVMVTVMVFLTKLLKVFALMPNLFHGLLVENILISLVPAIFIQYITREYQFHYKTKIISLFIIIGAILNVLLNLIFIENYGINGAIASTALAYLITLLMLINFQKVLRNNILKYLLINISLLYLFFIVDDYIGILTYVFIIPLQVFGFIKLWQKYKIV
jgi:O-antigen/teichoic acid export membrane protein